MPDTGGPVPDWFEEFKKVNQATPAAAAGAAAPPEKGGTKERRKAERFDVSQVSCKLYRKGFTSFMGLSRVTLEGSVTDLSEGGVQIALGERLFPDTKIHLRIEIPKFHDVIESDGVVRWCREVPKHEPPLFNAGVMFSGLTPTESKKIASMRIYYTSAQHKLSKDPSA